MNWKILVCCGLASWSGVSQLAAQERSARTELKSEYHLDLGEQEGVLRVHTVGGRLLSAEQTSGEILRLIPNQLLAEGAVVSFSRPGSLTQSLVLHDAANRAERTWRPQFDQVGVILYLAEGKGSRKMKMKWPPGSRPMSREFGRPVSELLGLNQRNLAHPGFYLTGDIRTIPVAQAKRSDCVSVELSAATLTSPLNYQLTIEDFGAKEYSVFEFPIVEQGGQNDFEFELLGSFEGSAEGPEHLGLELELPNGSRMNVIASRKEGTVNSYLFRAPGKRVVVHGPIFERWDLLGISSAIFEPFELVAESSAPMKLKGVSYVSFPESFGLQAIPGVRYSVKQLRSDAGQSPIVSQYFLEGGGAFLPPGEYALVARDSLGGSLFPKDRAPVIQVTPSEKSDG